MSQKLSIRYFHRPLYTLYTTPYNVLRKNCFKLSSDDCKSQEKLKTYAYAKKLGVQGGGGGGGGGGGLNKVTGILWDRDQWEFHEIKINYNGLLGKKRIILIADEIYRFCA